MSFAYLPLYTGDYLRDTRACSMAEHGAYLLLLIHCWDTREPVPLDEREAAGICNARSGDELEAMRRVLRRYFTRMDDGWYNRRMQLEIERSENISKARSEAGIRGYQARAKQLPSKSLASASNPIPIPTSTPSPLKPTVVPDGTTRPKPSASDPVPYQRIVDLYHQLLPELPRCIRLSDQRKAAIRSRWKGKDAEDLGDWEAYFGLVRKSRFLMGLSPPGNGHKQFRADLEWLTKEANFLKVLEGKYE